MSKRDETQFKIGRAADMIVKALPPIETHPGVYLRETILPQWGLNVTDLSRKLGVNRPNLHEVLQGRSDISRDLAYKLGALLRDEVADFLIAYQHAFDLAKEAGKRVAYRETIERIAVPG